MAKHIKNIVVLPILIYDISPSSADSRRAVVSYWQKNVN